MTGRSHGLFPFTNEPTLLCNLIQFVDGRNTWRCLTKRRTGYTFHFVIQEHIILNTVFHNSSVSATISRLGYSSSMISDLDHFTHQNYVVFLPVLFTCLSCIHPVQSCQPLVDQHLLHVVSPTKSFVTRNRRYWINRISVYDAFCFMESA